MVVYILKRIHAKPKRPATKDIYRWLFCIHQKQKIAPNYNIADVVAPRRKLSLIGRRFPYERRMIGELNSNEPMTNTLPSRCYPSQNRRKIYTKITQKSDLEPQTNRSYFAFLVLWAQSFARQPFTLHPSWICGQPNSEKN